MHSLLKYSVSPENVTSISFFSEPSCGLTGISWNYAPASFSECHWLSNATMQLRFGAFFRSIPNWASAFAVSHSINQPVSLFVLDFFGNIKQILEILVVVLRCFKWSVIRLIISRNWLVN